MDEINIKEGVEIALDAIIQDRLSAICGAGLSMAAPSNIPCAWEVAQKAKEKYDGIFGTTRPALSEDIEKQAEYFHYRDELDSMYLERLVDNDTFSAPPNSGHFAVADLLLTQSIKLALSTNVDALIENAGNLLFGDVVTGITRDDAAAHYPAKAPLLKIHGCWKLDRKNTVWAPSQLKTDPNKTRIEECAVWATQQLLNRDLIIVGYFTDWDYLNELFEECLKAVLPSKVIVIDPSTEDDLRKKAPKLFEIGDATTAGFYHVRESGAEYLDELRRQWSMIFIRRVLSAGNQMLLRSGDPRADNIYCEPPNAPIKYLWEMRRDLEGVGPNDACKRSKPHDDPNLGYAHVILRAAGAQLEGSYWLLNGQRIRIIRSTGKALNDVKNLHASSVSFIASADVTIAVGAKNYGLKANIARSDDDSSVVRARASRFMTLEEAESEFDLG